MVAAIASLPLAAGDLASTSFRLIVEEACEQAPGTTWQIDPDLDASGTWLRVRNEGARCPAQGWKLHVSAGVGSAEVVLRQVLPVLLAEDADFKLAATPRVLATLNEGYGGFSQVGKFVTVYPNDDAQAIRLAAALDEATRGLRGPAIPSDRPLRSGGLVHYRYGGFGERMMQTPLGEILPALVAPNGELVPDRRLGVYRPPEWAADPFIAAAVAAELPTPTPLIGGRFLIVSTLHRSPWGAVHLAVDVEQPRRVVLKQARRDAQLSADGVDARDRLRYEVEVLRRLAPDPRFPTPFDLVEQDDDLFLVMEDVEGETLEQHLAPAVMAGRNLPGAQVVAWGREVVAMLAAIHAKGFVYRDLKSPNVILAPDGRLRLIDFDLAHDPAATEVPTGLGTRGYMSRQQHERAAPTIADDVYGLGALLVFMATGVDPSHAPDPFTLLARPLPLLNPAVGSRLAAVIVRCLDQDPAARYPSMAALEEALAAVEEGASVAPPPFGGEAVAEPEAAARLRAAELAIRLGDTLCAAAESLPVGRGVAWRSTHRVAGGLRSRDINSGGGGTLLALAELVAAYDRPEHRAVLTAGAHWLVAAPRPGGAPVAGLYVGEAGVGAALLRAGQVLADAELIAAAAERGRFVATLPHASPDLFNGTAGRLRFHLLLWDEIGDREHLDHAVAAGEALLAGAEDTSDGGLRWTIPAGYGGLSGRANLGYAHGAAGIADALLDLVEATGEGRFRDAARDAGRWLARQAVPVLDDGSGLGWPTEEGGTPTAAFWCHGATGIGRFFLHAAALDLLPGAAGLAAGAARAVARGARWAGPTQCHGLAGNVELLLEAYQATGDHAHLTEARSLARLLEAFGSERDGRLVWTSESPYVVTPDYMVGYAGVVPCLLRLADPERRPHQLCRRGFRYGRAVVGKHQCPTPPAEAGSVPRI